MTFTESNTATLGLGISFDSDGRSTSPSLPSSPSSLEDIFSDVPLSSSVSDPDSSPTLGGTSDEDNLTVYSDDELNVFFVDRRELAAEQIQVADFLPWPTGSPQAAPARPARRASVELNNSDFHEVDVAEGYESDADEYLDDLLWRRGRAKRRRVNRSRAGSLVQNNEPVFDIVIPSTPANRAASAATPASQDRCHSPMAAVHPAAEEEPTTHTGERQQHDEEHTDDVYHYGSEEYVPGETEVSQLMGQMDVPSDSSECEEFYSSDEDCSRPKRVHYTCESHPVTFYDLPPLTEEEVEFLRQGYALGLPMEDIMPTAISAMLFGDDEADPVESSSGDAHASESDLTQSGPGSSDSLETVDLNTTSDEDGTLVEDAAPEPRNPAPTPVPPSAPASPPLFTTAGVQLGPFCVAAGPVLPFAPAPCNTPTVPTRNQPLDFFSLGRGHLSL